MDIRIVQKAGLWTAGLFFLMATSSPLNAFSDTTLPEKIRIEYTWTGLSEVQVEKEEFFLTHISGKQYESDAHLIYRDGMLSPTHEPFHRFYKRYVTTIPESVVGTLQDALDIARWTPAIVATPELRNKTRLAGSNGKAWVVQVETEHTDDSPYTEINFVGSTGQTLCKIFSYSNTRDNSPWNLAKDDQLSDTRTPMVGAAIQALMQAVQPGHIEDWPVFSVETVQPEIIDPE